MTLSSVLEYALGSGFALAGFSALYYLCVKGRINIPKDFLDIHESKTKIRYRIKIQNKGYKSLNNLCCLLSISNLDKNDIYEGPDNNKYFISRNNYIPIIDELITWDIGETKIDLHPKLSIDIDICHFHKVNKTLEFPSELGYTDNKNEDNKSRVLITNIKEYDFVLKLFAQDHKPKIYHFRIYPNSDRTYLDIIKV